MQDIPFYLSTIHAFDQQLPTTHICISTGTLIDYVSDVIHHNTAKLIIKQKLGRT